MRVIADIDLAAAGSDDEVAASITTGVGVIHVKASGVILLPDGRVFRPAVERPVPVEQYNELKARSARLGALEAAGVDNWSGYDVAMGILHSDEEE